MIYNTQLKFAANALDCTKSSGLIKIYKLVTNRLVLYQNIEEPQVLSPKCDPNFYDCNDYKVQDIDYGASFSWNTRTCDSFFVGAPSGKEFNRFYQFLNASVDALPPIDDTNGEKENQGSGNESKPTNKGLSGVSIA